MHISGRKVGAWVCAGVLLAGCGVLDHPGLSKSYCDGIKTGTARSEVEGKYGKGEPTNRLITVYAAFSACCIVEYSEEDKVTRTEYRSESRCR